jgi:amino acid transporter
MLCAIVLAIPDMEAAALEGEQCFFAILRIVVPQPPVRLLLYAGLVAAMYLCGLATMTAASRMAFGFARDGGLPFSRALSRIGSHDTPSVAIWTVAGVAIGFAATISYESVSAVCAIFLYIAYILPTVMGLLTYRRWSHLAVWHVGRWYRPLAVAGVLGCLVLVGIGMQPPNEITAAVVAALLVVLVVLWLGYMRRHFPGPPPEVLERLRPTKAEPSESAET